MKMITGIRQRWLANLLAISVIGLLLIALLLMWLTDSLISPDVLSYLFIFNAFLPVGWLIARRIPENPIGWLFLAIAITTNLSFVMIEYAQISLVMAPGSLPGGLLVALLVGLVQPAAWMLMFTSLLLFPTGKPVNRGWGVFIWVNIALYQVVDLLAVVASPTINYFPTVENPLYIPALASYPDVARGLIGFLNVLALSITAILRFRRTDPIEKLQLKWFVFGVVAWPALGILEGLLHVPQEVSNSLSVIGILFPLSAIAIAILRHRLYDIDIIIRRTLVYAILTGTLALVYWGGVLLLNALLSPLTGGSNDLAVVATTLVVAGVFFPLRRVIQNFIDRRFYRRKYDAARTLAAFGRVARDEVDLNALSRELVGVVEETMQPTYVSVWLTTKPGSHKAL